MKKIVRIDKTIEELAKEEGIDIMYDIKDEDTNTDVDDEILILNDSND